MRGMPAGTDAEFRDQITVGMGLPELTQSRTVLDPALAVTLGVAT